uniref:C2H2-type domain-containing protein n=1 Tax=Loa loa TaxID=7209 RepID=A0A1I7V6U9_LOALO
MYMCPHVDCNATIQDKGKYDRHFQTHKKPFHHQCKHPGCGKEYYAKSSFSTHIKSRQHKPQDLTGGNPQLGHTLAYTRNHHGQSSSGQRNYSAMIGQKYKCRYCNATMQTKEEYSEHLETQKEYNCTWLGCEMKFCSRSALQQHYNIHQPRPQCENCGYLFPRNRTLRIHQQRCHGGS